MNYSTPYNTHPTVPSNLNNMLPSIKNEFFARDHGGHVHLVRVGGHVSVRRQHARLGM